MLAQIDLIPVQAGKLIFALFRWFKVQLAKESLVDVLQMWAQDRGSKMAFTCLSDDDTGDLCIDFSTLDRSVRSIAVELHERGAQGERVLLLFPPGIEFVTAFLACLYAGAVAVPSYPPAPSRRERSSGGRLVSIVRDASPAFALTTSSLRPRVDTLVDGLGMGEAITILSPDQFSATSASAWKRPDIDVNALALLQYTSGSTGDPKGVMISHSNIMDNMALIHDAIRIDENDTGVNWLPPYHDMGLIGGLLQPVYEGSKVTLLSPVSFLQRPFRWLEAISKTRATVSGGPNFAYDLCVKRITEEQKAQLDLSCWRAALNGAEPVDPVTLQSFSEAFASCGFSSKAWAPCYGMAETTLFVCGGPAGSHELSLSFDRSELEVNRAVPVSPMEAGGRAIVSCGKPMGAVQISIVDPISCERLRDGEIGEVWVRSKSIGLGYWNSPELSRFAFDGRINGSAEGPYLRTGDLGFVLHGELYIIGRRKDLIVSDGRNIYPHHIENTIEAGQPFLRRGGTASFVVHLDDDLQIVLLCEVEREAITSLDSDAVVSAIRRHVEREHRLEAHTVCLLKPGGIPKTSSGKTQRYACRDLYLSGSLETIASWSTSD